MYRATQQWDHWLTQNLGHRLLEAEKKLLDGMLATYYGKHALLIGVPHQHELLKTSVTANHMILSPLISKTREIKTIEGDFHELPIASGSVDLVLLPHTMEYLDNPHQLLSEACRIVKPEGHIIILGFRKWSAWGLKRFLNRHKHLTWAKKIIPVAKVKKWLGLADFELVKQDACLFRPPVHHHGIYKKLKFLDWIGRKLFKPLGGVYVLVAKAKIIPLTPIRMRWQQKLSSLPVGIPGPSMRKF